MSSIGSGPGISSGPQIDLSASRPVNPVGAQATAAAVSAPQVPAQPAAPTVAAQSQAGVVATTTAAVSAATPPIDSERVASIRKAIQTGNYPIIPTKIGDAMIAAGILLRTGK